MATVNQVPCRFNFFWWPYHLTILVFIESSLVAWLKYFAGLRRIVSSHITAEILYMCILLTYILKTTPAVTQIGPEKDAKQNLPSLLSRFITH